MQERAALIRGASGGLGARRYPNGRLVGMKIGLIQRLTLRQLLLMEF